MVVRTPRCSNWEPPPLGWLTCNFDCSYQEGSVYAGIGWIVRDHHGTNICSGTVKLKNGSSPLQGESLAFLYVLQQVWIRG